jgi:hypothetical protein
MIYPVPFGLFSPRLMDEGLLPVGNNVLEYHEKNNKKIILQNFLSPKFTVADGVHAA